MKTTHLGLSIKCISSFITVASTVKSLYTFETTPWFLPPMPQLFKNWDNMLHENLILWG